MKFPHVNTEVTFNKISVSLVLAQFKILWSSGRVKYCVIKFKWMHGCIVTLIVQVLIHCIIPCSRKAWQIDSFQAFGERKFGELIDQPIGYQL